MSTKKDYIITDENTDIMSAPPGFNTLSEALEVAKKSDNNNHFGLVKREPVRYKFRKTALDMPLIPRDEWVERIREGHEKKQFLCYYRRSRGPNNGMMPSYDQNGQGYCWYYDFIAMLTLVRAAQGQKYVRLSGHSGACRIKNFRDEGGWVALAVDHAMENGVNSVDMWPEQSMSRSNDTPESKREALQYRPREAWIDLADAVYDRNLTEEQRVTNLLLNNPVGADRYRWSHSTCDMNMELSSRTRSKKSLLKTRLQDLDLNDPKDLVIYESIVATRGWNSWGDRWGSNGEFVMEGSQQRMDGGVAITSAIAS